MADDNRLYWENQGIQERRRVLDALFGPLQTETYLSPDGVPYEPAGEKFWSKSENRELMLVGPGQVGAGWVACSCSDGRWALVRELPTHDDWRSIDTARLLGYTGRRP